MKGLIRLVGIGDDGCLSLTSRAMNAIAEAEVLAGSERHLSFVPQFEGTRLNFISPLASFIDAIIETAQTRDICVLASGDPLFFGIGARLIRQAKQSGMDVEVIPSLSSVQLACARYGLSNQALTLLSVHGRPIEGIVAKLQQGSEFAVLTDAVHTPQKVAAHLSGFDEHHWQISVCEALGGVGERCRDFSVEELAQGNAGDVNPLNLMLLRRGDQAPWNGKAGHCGDDDYVKRTPLKGLITKAPIRAVAVANLNLRPESIMWDIGSASGSVAIESAKQTWKGSSYAIECNPECYELLRENQRAHKVDNLNIIKERAPDALHPLPAPDAVFCGGSRGEMDQIFPIVMDKLRPNGRFILSAVTLDSINQIFNLCQQYELTPQILMLNVSQAKPLAQYTSYQAQNPIHLFIIEKSN